MATGDEELREPSGAVLVLENGELFRRRGKTRIELACVEPEGTGRVSDIALDPSGLVFVAADNGLFVLGPWVDALDRVELLEGAPLGTPTSVHVDAQRRVWLATDEEVGVIDPSFYWGRTLEEELLPGDGPYRLEAHEGSFTIRGSEGASTYTPDAEDTPQLERVLAGERGIEEGSPPLHVEYGGSILVRAQGKGRGGATFRYRVDGHHVWKDLGEALRLEGLSPGRHVLDVVALDRDLNRSAPRSIGIDVGYPFYFEKRFVLAFVGTGALGVLAYFVWRARGRGASALARALVSTALVLVIVLQVLAGLFPHAKGWPFVGYSMYSRRYAENEEIYEGVLVGLRPDQREFVIDPQAIGVAIDSRWQVLRPLIDGGETAQREYVEAFRKRFPRDAIAGLQVQARRVRLTDRGPLKVAPLVLSHWREERGG